MGASQRRRSTETDTTTGLPEGTPGTELPQLRSPDDVLYANELKRSYLWTYLTSVLGGVGMIIAVAWPGPDLGARKLLGFGCLFLAVASAVAQWVLRTGRYSRSLSAFYSYLCVIVMLSAYYYFGWFSAIVALVPIGGIMFSMGQSTASVVGMATATKGTHALLGALVIAGVIEDHGVASIHTDDTIEQIIYLVTFELMLGSSFLIGRQLRRHALNDVERYGVAVRESARREALLNEALDELRRVRAVGDAGRYSGLTIGSFQLGSVIGRGGMGEVYEAVRVGSEEPAAVKVLSSAGAFDQYAARRFAREIEAAASIDSPHIVRVLEHSAADDPIHYLAMEKLEGRALADELRTVRRLSVGRTIEILRQVGRGVDTAHRAGVVHRDLKPHNLFLHSRGGEEVWKVLDFGVSKLVGKEGTLTAGAVVGTPRYMSPEQASSGEVDHRSDLFSLGCVAYRCLTGRPPFAGREVVDIMYSVVHHMPQQPSVIAPLPHEVDLVLAVALAKDPDHRFDSSAQLVNALAEACDARIDDQLQRRGEALLALQPWSAG